MDVGDLAAVRAGVAEAASRLGRLDILVNNAADAKSNPALDVTPEDFSHTLDVNLHGTFFASQAAATIMIKQRFGRIVNLSSQAGFVALPGGVRLLHDQGGDRPPHEVPRRRVG